MYRIPITGTTGILIQVKVKLQTKITESSQLIYHTRTLCILSLSFYQFTIITIICPIDGVLDNNNSPYGSNDQIKQAFY